MNGFLLYRVSWFVFIVMQVFFSVLWNVERSREDMNIFEKGTTCCLKNKELSVSARKQWKLMQLLQLSSIQLDLIWLVFWDISLGLLQSATKLLRLKWSNFGEQTGFPVKWRLEKEWRNSIMMTCEYPCMQILSGKCFWFTAGWSKFPSWYDQFERATYTCTYLVTTCYQCYQWHHHFCGKPMVISWNITCFPRAKLPLLG